LKLSVTAALITAGNLLAQDKVPLKTDLPKPLFVGTPVPIKVPNLEPPQKGKRPDFMVPAGTVNLARGKKVTASDNDPVIGTLDLITDGDKEGDEGSWVELAPANNGCRLTWKRTRIFTPCSSGISIHRRAFTLTSSCRFPTTRTSKKT
jgi:hypothetical protein